MIVDIYDEFLKNAKFQCIGAFRHIDYQDVAQTAILKIMNIYSISDRSVENEVKNISAWSYKVIRNTIYNYIEWDIRYRNNIDALQKNDIDMHWNSCNKEYDENLESFKACIDELGTFVALREIEKSIIILRCFYGLSYDEIADTLKISAGNARIIMHRAVEKLRKIENVDKIIRGEI